MPNNVLFRQGLRRCSECKGVFAATNKFFHRHKNRIGGFASRCKPCSKKLISEYRIKNRDKLLQYMKDYAFKFRIDVLTHYGGKCVCCGEKEIKFLSMDHINNDGKKHRDEIKGWGNNMYRWLAINGYPNFVQILCHNCNQAKAFYKSCPHKDECDLKSKSCQ